MQITEIFRSIQGESTHAGLPCIFVRLTGCTLRCTWCDTAYAFYGGKTMAVAEVLDAVHAFSQHNVHPIQIEIHRGRTIAWMTTDMISRTR